MVLQEEGYRIAHYKKLVTCSALALLLVCLFWRIPLVTANAPSVDSVTPSDMLIADNDVTGTFTVTVVYNQDMNTGILPDIVFNPPVASTLTFTGGEWQGDNRTYIASYTVGDGNIEVTGVGILVENAQNADNELQTPSSNPGAFSIDTKNPTVVGVAPSEPLINDFTGAFSIQVSFSEDMDFATAPRVFLSLPMSQIPSA